MLQAKFLMSRGVEWLGRLRRARVTAALPRRPDLPARFTGRRVALRWPRSNPFLERHLEASRQCRDHAPSPDRGHEIYARVSAERGVTTRPALGGELARVEQFVGCGQGRLVGFVEAQKKAAAGELPPTTFEEFAVSRFGRGITKHFFVPYNSKLWGMHPNALTAATTAPLT